jgi:hypothetical protein
MRTLIRIVTGAALAWSGLATAQTQTTGVAEPAKAQGELLPARPPELDKLAKFDGLWSSEVTMTQQGKTLQGKARVTCNPTADRWATLCTMVIHFPGQKTMEATELFAYDLSEKQFHWVSAGNSGELLARELHWTGENDATARGTHKGPEGKGTLTDNATFHWKNAETIEFKSTTTLDGKPFGSFTATFARSARSQARTPPSK